MPSGCRCQCRRIASGRPYGLRMSEVLHDVYLPFTEAQLRQHFAPVGADNTSADRHLAYYRKSVQAARDWTSTPPSGTPTEQAQAKRRGLQTQKDERFW